MDEFEQMQMFVIKLLAIAVIIIALGIGAVLWDIPIHHG